MTLFHPCYVVDDGMIPTAEAGSRLIGDRTSYWLRKPERGDFVLTQFTYANGKKSLYLSRIIGLPKEKVEINQGEILINNESLEEPYLANQGKYERCVTLVPPKAYFTLLDNREMAYKYNPSCEDQLVLRDEIIAKITGRIFSWQALE
jgi:signal peptidase I